MEGLDEVEENNDFNYVIKVKEEIDKLLKVGFIHLVKKAIWLSPIVVLPKKNGASG